MNICYLFLGVYLLDVCILSANGAVTTVTLRQPSTSGGTVTYEGQFEILSLSGSYLLSNSSGPQGLRTGSLSICLASPDGRVIGGGVGGVVIAASPVQVILGSFMCWMATRRQRANARSWNQTIRKLIGVLKLCVLYGKFL